MSARTFPPVVARVFYGLFLCLATYYALGPHDFLSAASNLGIGLIFDPFDDSVSFPMRPLWQRVWLICHLTLLLTLFGLYFVL
mgnify:FL=1